MAETEKKILIVDDEESIRDFLSYNLKKAGFSVKTACDGIEAVEKTKQFLPDLILMDVMMPNMNGFEATRKIQALYGQQKEIRIAFLTAMDDDESQIKGFETGADDFISKPIKPKILLARIQALLKRRSATPVSSSEILEFSDFSVDVSNNTLIKDGQSILLPRKEFELLLLLVTHPDKLFHREEIYNTIWGENTFVGDRTIDVHIRRLRQKIGSKHVETVKGVGYRFVR